MVGRWGGGRSYRREGLGLVHTASARGGPTAVGGRGADVPSLPLPVDGCPCGKRTQPWRRLECRRLHSPPPRRRGSSRRGRWWERVAADRLPPVAGPPHRTRRCRARPTLPCVTLRPCFCCSSCEQEPPGDVCAPALVLLSSVSFFFVGKTCLKMAYGQPALVRRAGLRSPATTALALWRQAVSGVQAPPRPIWKCICLHNCHPPARPAVAPMRGAHHADQLRRRTGRPVVTAHASEAGESALLPTPHLVFEGHGS